MQFGSFTVSYGPWWAARHSGFVEAEAIEMSFLMNNRGLMERVVLEVGLGLGVIPRSLFTMPVFITVLRTAITGPSIEGVGTTCGVPLPDGDRA
jgi:Kef-type K+ transport system membrane component KefB